MSVYFQPKSKSEKPGLFGLATIGYLKALGLCVISKILFGKNE